MTSLSLIGLDAHGCDTLSACDPIGVTWVKVLGLNHLRVGACRGILQPTPSANKDKQSQWQQVESRN